MGQEDVSVYRWCYTKCKFGFRGVSDERASLITQSANRRQMLCPHL